MTPLEGVYYVATTQDDHTATRMVLREWLEFRDEMQEAAVRLLWLRWDALQDSIDQHVTSSGFSASLAAEHLHDRVHEFAELVGDYIQAEGR